MPPFERLTAPPAEAPFPRIWALLGHRTGDNMQVLALATELANRLGGQVEIKPLSYTPLHIIPNRLAGRSIAALTRDSRTLLVPPWPDIVIGLGQRSLPAARWIQACSGGRTRTVWIGWPRCRPNLLDVVVTTPNYPVPGGPNVLRLPIAISRITPERLERAAAEWAHLRATLPGPWSVLLIGGRTWPWRLDARALTDAIGVLVARAHARGGSVLATTSRRTPPEITAAVRTALEESSVPTALFTPEDPAGNPYEAMLALAEDITVTEDSVAMLSEAVTAGKKVGLVEATVQPLGGFLLELQRPFHPGQDGDGTEPESGWPRLRTELARAGLTDWFRDIRLFGWMLRERGIVGTAAVPRRSNVAPPVRLAADWVIATLDLKRSEAFQERSVAILSQRPPSPSAA